MTIRLWDSTNGQELQRLEGHTASVLSVAFSPDGTTIVSAGADATVRLWDAATGKELRRLTGHEDAVRSAAFSPDGQTIVSASEDGTVRLWVASIDDLLQMADERIQRPAHILSAEERRHFGLDE